MVSADVAILIPTFNEAAQIAAVLSHVQDLGEVIVVDGGSTDGTVAIAAAFPSIEVIEGPRGRGAQLNAAAHRAHAPVLLFLHADTRLPAGAIELIRQTLADRRVAAGCFRVRFDDAHPALRLFSWFSRFDTLFTTFGDQGYFVRREDFLRAGGFPEWPLLEDVEVRRRLKRIGAFRKVPLTVTTSARRFRARGPWRAQVENAMILAAFNAGVPAERLARYYHRGRKPGPTPR